MQLRSVKSFTFFFGCLHLFLPIALAQPISLVRDIGSRIPEQIFIYGSEADFDFRLTHSVAVVKEALRVDEDKLGKITIQSTGDNPLTMNRSRVVKAIEQNKGEVHVLASMASRELDEKLLAIPISIGASYLGERSFLVKEERRKEIESIRSIEELKPYITGLGKDWIDNGIMRAAGLKTMEVVRYESLFPMLEGDRFDLLTRGVHEAWDELRVRAFQGIDYTSSWGLAYPAPYYLYVGKQQKALAARLTHGLLELEKRGMLRKLFVEYFGPSILRIDSEDRKRIRIPNPYLPLTPPLRYKSWEDWYKVAEKERLYLYRAARERFRPNWSGPYRPENIIQAGHLSRKPKVSFSEQAAKDREGAPVIFRGAERGNDTRMLAAYFGLRFALEQNLDSNSLFFGRKAEFLMERGLDQATALERLASGLGVDAVGTESSIARERDFAGAHVDLMGGLLGARVLVVLHKRSDLFKKVEKLEDLRAFRLCVGSHWPDRFVFEEAKIPIFAAAQISELYQALKDERCDGISRAIYEVRDELLSRPDDDFAAEPHLLITYPASMEVFFAKGNVELARLVEANLKRMEKSGLLQELTEVLFGDAIRHVGMNQRREIGLKNPAAPEHVTLENFEATKKIWAK